ncbi:hypothetical protein [Singulisphaera acidiphila]|uniref:hypothetical protein n=1 Tax=Singulisphaera acidiphila TaxID=466153 RepID=UPI001FD0030D|nr:hypothetical protein [Singulisphaera acidiphila]
MDSTAHFDGRVYKILLEEGYNYESGSGGTVAFFPLYPLLGRLVAGLTGLSAVMSLILVSYGCLLAAYAVFGRYLSVRKTEETQPELPRPELSQEDTRSSPRRWDVSSWQGYAFLSLALWPTTFFFRMAFTESLFLLLALLSLYAIERQWPLIFIAGIMGVASASRPVGVALVLPLALHVMRQRSSARQRVEALAYLLPIACSGLIVYMAYLDFKFDDALAFAKAHDSFRMRGQVPLKEKLLALLSWEPVWGVYDPSQPGYWARFDPPNPLLNWKFMNPIYFGVGVLSTGWGWWRRWLTEYELALAVPLLAIPYLTRGFEMCMHSQARYASVVFPTYIVMGHLLVRVPEWVRGVTLMILGGGLFVYSALFAAGYEIY